MADNSITPGLKLWTWGYPQTAGPGPAVPEEAGPYIEMWAGVTRQFFEKDRALVRRFQKIDINEPSVSDAIDILKGLKPDVLQTDAALNYVNLGGAAVDLDGRLVGMPVWMTARAGVNSGVGFLVPTAAIFEALPKLERGAIVPKPQRAFLGVQLGNERLEPAGLEIAQVLADTAAAKAGLEKGDLILLTGFGAGMTWGSALIRW